MQKWITQKSFNSTALHVTAGAPPGRRSCLTGPFHAPRYFQDLSSHRSGFGSKSQPLSKTSQLLVRGVARGESGGTRLTEDFCWIFTKRELCWVFCSRTYFCCKVAGVHCKTTAAPMRSPKVAEFRRSRSPVSPRYHHQG